MLDRKLIAAKSVAAFVGGMAYAARMATALTDPNLRADAVLQSGILNAIPGNGAKAIQSPILSAQRNK